MVTNPTQERLCGMVEDPKRRTSGEVTRQAELMRTATRAVKPRQEVTMNGGRRNPRGAVGEGLAGSSSANRGSDSAHGNHLVEAEPQRQKN